MFNDQRGQLVDLAAKSRLPALFASGYTLTRAG
jgi:hypothetical protein